LCCKKCERRGHRQQLRTDALADVSSVIPVDEVIGPWVKSERAWRTRYKETALGGLAATPTAQRIAKKVLIRDIEMLPDENQ